MAIFCSAHRRLLLTPSASAVAVCAIAAHTWLDSYLEAACKKVLCQPSHQIMETGVMMSMCCRQCES